MPIPDRCRLVLIAPENLDPESLPAILAAGDVASLLLPQYGLDDAAFQKIAETITPRVQAVGVAVVIAGDTRIAARVKADGVHVEGSPSALADAVDRLQDKMMVGTGGAKTRDEALDLGEARPDYMFFGRFGYDTKPEAHSRNLSLGKWWAEMIEIPAIVMAGSTLQSIADVARTGAEFVAASQAIFGTTDPVEALRQANALLDETARQRAEAD